MAQITMALPPTLLWQQFEALTRDVVSIVYSDPNAHAYGNQGATQHGVDVFCHENGDGRLIGVQCKRLGKNDAQGRALAGGLKIRQIDTEISKAETFPNQLQHYVIATTDSRRTEVQDYAIHITAKRKQTGKFTFDVWFWDDFLSNLHKYSKLLQWYYDNILELKGIYSFDHQILYLIEMAFSRAAFTTTLMNEGGNTELSDGVKRH